MDYLIQEPAREDTQPSQSLQRRRGCQPRGDLWDIHETNFKIKFQGTSKNHRRIVLNFVELV